MALQNALSQALSYLGSGVQSVGRLLPQFNPSQQAPSFTSASPKVTANAMPSPVISPNPSGGSFMDHLKSSWGQLQSKIQQADKPLGDFLMNRIYTPTQYMDTEHPFTGGVAPNVKPTVGKFIGGTAEDIMNAMIPSSGGVAEGIAKAPNILGGIKGAFALPALSATIQKLKGEKIDPTSTALSGFIGFGAGIVSPKPMEGLPKTELAQARRTLTEFGFKLADFSDTSALKSKFSELVKTLHPDKGGNPEEFAKFIDAFNKATSAKIEPTWGLKNMTSWIKGLWDEKSKETTKVVGGTQPLSPKMEVSASQMVKLNKQRTDLIMKGLQAEDAGNIALANQIKSKIAEIDTKISPPTANMSAKAEVAQAPTAPDIVPPIETSQAPIAPTETPTSAPVAPSISEPPVAPPAEVVPPEIPKGTKQRGFVKTVKESPTTSPEVVPLVEGNYKVKTNKRTLTASQQYIKEVGYDAAKERALGGEYSAESAGIAQELMRVAQKEGHFQDAGDIATQMSIKGTNAGQFTQAFAMWARMTPEGMLKHVAKQFQDAEKNMDVVTKATRGALGKKMPKLDAETTKVITDLMKKAQAASTEEEQAGYVRQVFEVVNKKLPWGVWDVIDEYRNANMLSNPITHLRNLTTNLQQAYFTRPATILASGKPVDAIKYEIGAIGALPRALTNAFNVFKEGRSIERLDQLDLSKYKPSHIGPLLNAPLRGLLAADEFFSTIIQAGEKARGATEIEGFKAAKYSLFNQDLKPKEQGYVLNKIDDITRGVYSLRRVGLGWFIPFVKVSMNVAKQWIEYSPAGLATLPGAANKKEQFSKVIVGSLATLLGAKVATEGRTTWTAPTDQKARDLFYASGRKPFSIFVGKDPQHPQLGELWVPMSTFGPLAFAVALPAAAKYYQDQSRTALSDTQIQKLEQIATAGLQFWSQQTFVSQLGAFVNVAQGNTDNTVKKTLAYTATQVIPYSGMMRYLATVIDPIFRHPQGMMDQVKSGLPIIPYFNSKTVDPYLDPNGNPEQRNLSNYISPYAMGKSNPEFDQMYQMRNEQLQNNAYVSKLKKDAERAASSPNGADTVQAAEESNPAMNFDKPAQTDTSRLLPLMKTNIGPLNQSVDPTGTAKLKPVADIPSRESIQEKMFTGKSGIDLPKPQPVTGPDDFNLQFLTLDATIGELQNRITSLKSADIPTANKLQYIQSNQKKLQQAQQLRSQFALDPKNQEHWANFLNTEEGKKWFKSEVSSQKAAGTLPASKRGRKATVKKPRTTSTKIAYPKTRAISVPRLKISAPKAPRISVGTAKSVALPKLKAVKLTPIKIPKSLRKFLQ